MEYWMHQFMGGKWLKDVRKYISPSRTSMSDFHCPIRAKYWGAPILVKYLSQQILFQAVLSFGGGII